MENAPRNKNKKTALRAIEKGFLKRKECIKKKSRELSVLCDVKVCAIIVGPDGTVETWPEDRNDVQRVIETYRNCPVDKKKRERPQELDCGGGNKKQKLSVVSEGVKKTGFTDQDMLRRIDAKLCEVRKKIQSMKSSDQNSVDYTMANLKEPSFFQETASFDQSQIMDNPLWFDTQLEEIHGFEENDLFDWSEIFNTDSKNPNLTDRYQDLQSSTPAVNSLTPGNELVDIFSMAYNGELNQFTATDVSSFISDCEAVNYSTLPGNQCFKPNNGNELMDAFSMAYNGELNQFTATDVNSFISGCEAVNSSTLPDNQCFKPNNGNELIDTFSMACNGELNQLTATDVNSFISGCEAMNSSTLPGNQCFKPNWNWFEDSAFLKDLNS